LAREEVEELEATLRKVSLHRYPDVSGAPLREILAQRWNIAPEQILLGNGSVEVLANLMTAFGGGRGDRPARVLYPDPSFPHYEVIARINGVEPLPIALGPEFGLDERAFIRAIEEHEPELALFASPNNPSGNPFDQDTLERLARRLDGCFVVDEAYVDFAGTRSTLIERIRDTPGLFVTRTLSKIGFAGLRLGALIGAPEAIAELDKVRLPWNVNAVTQALAGVLLSHPERLEARIRAIVALRGALETELRAIPGLTVFPSQANFVLVRVPFAAQLVFERLLSHGVLVKNVSRPGLLDRCLRISVGTATENGRCVRALREALRER
jgi:histidinol-phosphate aminotransferase